MLASHFRLDHSLQSHLDTKTTMPIDTIPIVGTFYEYLAMLMNLVKSQRRNITFIISYHY